MSQLDTAYQLARQSEAMMIVIPPWAQAKVIFDQQKLGVQGVLTHDRLTILFVDPEKFSAAIPHPYIGG